MTRYCTLLARQTEQSRPFLTAVGIDTRVELSVASFTNAANKIANALLAEDLADASDAIGLSLPWHWQRFTWCAGAWLIGATVVPWAAPDECRVLVADPTTARELGSATRTPVITVSLHPLGLGDPSDVPTGAIDGTSIVRAQPDAFLGDPSSSAGTLLMLNGQSFDEADAESLAEQCPPGQRIALRPDDDARHWLVPNWYPLLGGGSVVIAERGADISAERAIEMT